MTKTKKIITTIIAFAMIFCTLFTMIIPASAATSSYGTQTRVINVSTKANWWKPGSESITLSQTKGVCTGVKYNLWFQKSTVQSNQYGIWDVVASATDGSHTVKKTLSGSSLKIDLKPDKTYRITVSWSNRNTFTQIDHGNFTTLPTWRVKSTYKVSSCY